MFILTPELGAAVVRLYPLWGFSPPCNLEKADTRVLLNNLPQTRSACCSSLPLMPTHHWRLPETLLKPASVLPLAGAPAQSCLGYLLPRCAQVVTSISFLRHSFETFCPRRETSLFENRSSVHWLCLDKNDEAMFLFPTNIQETRFEYYQVTENKELKELWFSHWNEE